MTVAVHLAAHFLLGLPEEKPGYALVLWGHVGDGNLHVNVVGPPAEDDRVDDAVFRLAVAMGGSISAEHGVGRAKLRWLHLTRSEADIRAMHAIKAALDPTGILNPGVLFPAFGGDSQERLKRP